jgi:hypothetical protein
MRPSMELGHANVVGDGAVLTAPTSTRPPIGGVSGLNWAFVAATIASAGRRHDQVSLRARAPQAQFAPNVQISSGWSGPGRGAIERV